VDKQEFHSTFFSVLVPTDFSALANRAIPAAYGLVAPGGVIHLLHVVARKPGENPDSSERLRSLGPYGVRQRKEL
jgi:hypothetical protein